MSADPVLAIERRWGALCLAIVLCLVVMAAYAGLHQAVMPQARVETIDPRMLHVAGEFTEGNLGSAVEPDGSVTVRVIGQQYSFTPQCILVPADTPITLRATSADTLHGFIVERTNLNLMLVPGYVASFTTRFARPMERAVPCHEFCGVGHQGMWGRIKVIDRAAFEKLSLTQGRLSCVAQ